VAKSGNKPGGGISGENGRGWEKYAEKLGRAGERDYLTSS
jgi:hypothetical protein